MKRAAYLGHDAAPLFEFLGITIVAPPCVQTLNKQPLLARCCPQSRAVSRRCHRDRPPPLSPVPAALVPGRNRRTVAGRYHRTDPGSSGGHQQNATMLLDEVIGITAHQVKSPRHSAELRLPGPREPIAIHLFRSQRVAAIGSRSQIGRRRHPDPPPFAARLRGGNRCRPDDSPTPADVCPGRLDRPGFRWLEQWTSSPTPPCPPTSAGRRGRLSVSSSLVEGRPAVLSR